MQDAPEDLYEAARAALLDPEKYPAEEIARRERLLEQTIVDLRAPLHPNCYLSPAQFAEEFGLLVRCQVSAGGDSTSEEKAPEEEKEDAPADLKAGPETAGESAPAPQDPPAPQDYPVAHSPIPLWNWYQWLAFWLLMIGLSAVVTFGAFGWLSKY